MNVSAASIDRMRSVIQANWQRGIQRECLYGVSFEFKLKGNPWRGDGEQANAARHLVAAIFCFLLQNGWVLKLSTDLSKYQLDKDTFYFKQAARPDPTVRMCAISFNEFDKIRVISGPPEVAQVVRSTILHLWYRGLQRECFYYGVPEYKMLGEPWAATGSETMQVRMFVGHLIEALDCAGWEVYASVDISQGNTSDSIFGDSDSWILRSKPHLQSAPKAAAYSV
jgi:hypothetical protein